MGVLLEPVLTDIIKIRQKFPDVQGLDTELVSLVKQIESRFAALQSDQTYWDDFSVPLTRDKQGQSSLPDYDFTELGLLFPEDDESEEIYLVMQMSHSKKLWSPIHLHVHYVQSSALLPIFEVKYRFYNNGEAVPATWTTIDTSAKKGLFDYASGDMLQIGAFPIIEPPKPEGLSANLDIKFYRQDNDMGGAGDYYVNGDVLTKYVDFHFEKDTDGSRKELEK